MAINLRLNIFYKDLVACLFIFTLTGCHLLTSYLSVLVHVFGKLALLMQYKIEFYVYCGTMPERIRTKNRRSRLQHLLGHGLVGDVKEPTSLFEKSRRFSR